MFDEVMDFIQEIPDQIMDLPSTVGEIFSASFEDIGELSYIGLGFGLMAFMFTYFTKKWTLDPFLAFMSPVESVFWMVATFAASAIGGYLVGRYFESTG
jgi:hypothetical protein